MYQWLVAVLVLSSLSGMGYYVKKQIDRSGLLATSSLVENSATSTLVPEQVIGIYVCDSHVHCPATRTIVISPEGRMTLLTSYNDGVEMLEETGIWKLYGTKSIQLQVTGNNRQIYDAPHIIIMRQNKARNLVGDIGGTTYKEWGNPLFVRQ